MSLRIVVLGDLSLKRELVWQSDHITQFTFRFLTHISKKIHNSLGIKNKCILYQIQKQAFYFETFIIYPRTKESKIVCSKLQGRSKAC